MNIQMDCNAGRSYKSPSQIVRVITEDWASKNLYCPSCDEGGLDRTPANTRAIDYICKKCASCYQLKSSSRWSRTRIPDAAYDAMIHAIHSDTVPSLFIMQYTMHWTVHNLIVIPSFFLSESAIEKRKPLDVSARRAGWIGCNILLSNIADEGKIGIVREGDVVDPDTVRNKFKAIKPFLKIGSHVRGWTLDVFRSISGLGRSRFSIGDVYSFEHDFAKIHPDNKNIRAKIRQQLQVLRDLGIIKFLGNGEYTFLPSPLRQREGL